MSYAFLPRSCHLAIAALLLGGLPLVTLPQPRMTFAASAPAASPAAAAPSTSPSTAAADAEAAMAQMRRAAGSLERSPGAEKFNVLISPPFVLAGNGTPEQLEAYRDKTVLAAARAPHAMYFKKSPTEPVLILLFENGRSYLKLSRKWLGDENVSPYGYFRADRIMVMNVGTGTGTLVHELTHALIAPDFPDVPRWFNEGVASLYEQCSFDGDTITGHANWRLPALQRAIRDGKLRPLETMISDPDFTNHELVGLNYAEARYLMFYLQEKGLLTTYYKNFRDNFKDDPTGLQTLKALIAPQKLDDFEKDWRAWVMTLHFP